MDAGTFKILESSTVKSLHALNFARSSTQATLVLTDLVSRYLTLLTRTCAEYAGHAGRTGLAVGDVLKAFDELGVSVEELKGFCETEAIDLGRGYAGITQRKSEELAEMRVLSTISYCTSLVPVDAYIVALDDGLRQDHDDAIPLVYAPVLTPIDSEEEYTSDKDEDDAMSESSAKGDLTLAKDYMQLDGQVQAEDEPRQNGDIPIVSRKRTPPLPLSPVSNPSSPPPRKRARTAQWRPPAHIPEFLPPFPSSPKSSPAPMHQGSQTPVPDDAEIPPLSLGPQNQATSTPRPQTPPPQPQVAVSLSSADYLNPVTFELSSSLSSSWQAPKQPQHSSHTSSSSDPSTSDLQALSASRARLPTTQTLYAAYHHVLTHPPPSTPPSNPGRHRVAMSLLAQMYTKPRWTPADTLFANAMNTRPRIVAPGPTHAFVSVDEPGGGQRLVPAFNGNGNGDSRFLGPPPTHRSVDIQDNIIPHSTQPTSRIPEIARHILSPLVYDRATKLAPPPPHKHPSGGENFFLQGHGIPAPWNQNLSTQPSLPNGTSKSKDSSQLNGKPNGKDAEKEGGTLSDANLFPTWQWESKSSHEPLLSGRKGFVSNGGNAGPSGGIRLSSAGTKLVLGRGRKQSEAGRTG